MPIIFGTTASGGDNFFTPQPPTIGTATNVGTSRAYNNGAATVTFTPSTSGGKATSFTATSTPGSLTGSASASPITVAGLQSATSYTFAVTAADAQGTSSASSASNSVTATTVPQAPTIGTVTDGGTGTTVSIPFTAGATGGSTITGYSIVSSPATTTQTTSSSPYTFTGLTAGTAYTFQVAATNANGTSSYSASSNSVTPVVPSSFYSIATVTAAGGETSLSFTSIPGTYKSLQIRINGKVSGGSASLVDILVRYNSDSASNYTYHELSGSGSSTRAQGFGSVSQTIISEVLPDSYSTLANVYGVAIFDIIDYSSTSKYKTLRSFNGGTVLGTFGNNDRIGLNSGLWTSTSAITSIQFSPNSLGNFIAGSTFALYGVK